MIMWGGVGGPKRIKLAARNMESRSLSQFLEPAVRNASRGTLTTAYNVVWHPHTNTSTFTLHFPQETTTAFHQDLLLNSYFTLHGLGQIIDICSDWSTALAQTAWKWNYVAFPPLRLLSDIGIIGGAQLLPHQ